MRGQDEALGASAAVELVEKNRSAVIEVCDRLHLCFSTRVVTCISFFLVQMRNEEPQVPNWRMPPPVSAAVTAFAGPALPTISPSAIHVCTSDVMDSTTLISAPQPDRTSDHLVGTFFLLVWRLIVLSRIIRRRWLLCSNTNIARVSSPKLRM